MLRERMAAPHLAAYSDGNPVAALTSSTPHLRLSPWTHAITLSTPPPRYPRTLGALPMHHPRGPNDQLRAPSTRMLSTSVCAQERLHELRSFCCTSCSATMAAFVRLPAFFGLLLYLLQPRRTRL